MPVWLKQGSASGNCLKLDRICFLIGWHATMIVWRVLWLLWMSLWLRRHISGESSSTPLMLVIGQESICQENSSCMRHIMTSSNCQQWRLWKCLMHLIRMGSQRSPLTMTVDQWLRRKEKIFLVKDSAIMQITLMKLDITTLQSFCKTSMWALGNYALIYPLKWIVNPCSAKQDLCLIQGLLEQIFECMNILWWPNADSIACIVLFQKWNNYLLKDGRLMIGQRRMSVMIKSFWRWKRKLIWKCSQKVQNCWTKKILMSRITSLTGIMMKWQLGKAERMIK